MISKTSHFDGSLMRQTSLTSDFFSKNRAALCNKILTNSIVLLQSAPEAIRNADSIHSWRQDSNFFYFTGINTPDCSLLLVPQKEGKIDEFLFVPSVDPEKEKWNGRMLTKEEAQEISGIKTVQPCENLATTLFRVQKWREVLFCDLNDNHPGLGLTPQHLFLSDLRRRLPGLQQKKLSLLTAALRVKKHPEELSIISQSLEIINNTLHSVMRKLKPGLQEYQIEAELSYQYIYQGCKRHGFEPIVAGGKNATILHYIENNDSLKDGDLVLIDTGGEFNMYSGDITRVYPVNGKFSKRQRECYQAVLEINKTFIRELKPGSSWNQLYKSASQLAGEIYTKYGFVKDPKKHLEVSYHRIGHFLGLDVHDVGRPDEPFEPGTVITVEPGLYLPEEGIGIRIEDNVVITENGCKVLSEFIPKEIEEIEVIMASES